MFNLIPKEVRFFDYFEQQSQHIIRAAALLREMVHNFADARAKAHAIKEVEHEGDHTTHEIIKKLNTTFITPIDREDIHDLASRLDDVLDYIEAAAERLVVYRIKEPTSACRALAEVIVHTTHAMDRTIKCLRTMDPGFHEHTVEVNRLENTADVLLRDSLAAMFDFVAAFGFGVSVARTVGKGVVETTVVDQWVILAGLIGAIVWDLITWVWGLPTSSSHALIGGFAGAAVVKAGFGSLIAAGLIKIGAFMILAPLIGMVVGFTLMVLVLNVFKDETPGRVDKVFRRGQLLSAAAYSLGHGTNDAQKTMGIIAVLLFSTGYLGPDFYVPFWVVLAAHAALGLGTMTAGSRIVKTMGMRITKLRPVGGFCAETAGAITLIGTAIGGIPVSTTQTISGSIMGVGAIQRFSAVGWGGGGEGPWGWVLTVSGSGVVGAAGRVV